MNPTNTQAEPLALYYPAHEALNNTIKLTALSFKIAEPVVFKDFKTNGQTKGLLQKPVEPWGFLWAKDISNLYEQTQYSVTRISLIQIFSAFEQFLTNTRAEIDRWQNTLSKQSLTGSNHDSDGSISLSKTFKLFGWDSAPIDKYRPLFDLFQECRNCVAHREGIANTKLVKIAYGDELSRCNNNWPYSTANKHLPDWPEFKNGSPIHLSPKHAILASTVCCSIAKYINTQTVQLLGSNGMIHMAVYYSLFCDEHLFRQKHSRTALNAVTYFLDGRYYSKNLSPEFVAKSIRQLKLNKKAAARHSELYDGERIKKGDKRRK